MVKSFIANLQEWSIGVVTLILLKFIDGPLLLALYNNPRHSPKFNIVSLWRTVTSRILTTNLKIHIVKTRGVTICNPFLKFVENCNVACPHPLYPIFQQSYHRQTHFSKFWVMNPFSMNFEIKLLEFHWPIKSFIAKMIHQS